MVAAVAGTEYSTFTPCVSILDSGGQLVIVRL